MVLALCFQTVARALRLAIPLQWYSMGRGDADVHNGDT